MICQGFVSPIYLTCKRAHTATTIGHKFLLRAVHFLLYGAGLTPTLWDSNTHTHSIWLELKGIFFFSFFKDQGVLQSPRAGDAAWGRVREPPGPRQPHLPSRCALGSPCFFMPVDKQGCLVNSAFPRGWGRPTLFCAPLSWA